MEPISLTISSLLRIWKDQDPLWLGAWVGYEPFCHLLRQTGKINWAKPSFDLKKEGELPCLGKRWSFQPVC